jgi:hypothetical protein
VVVELLVVLVERLRWVQTESCVNTCVQQWAYAGKERTWRNCEVFGSSVKMRIPYSDSA